MLGNIPWKCCTKMCSSNVLFLKKVIIVKFMTHLLRKVVIVCNLCTDQSENYTIIIFYQYIYIFWNNKIFFLFCQSYIPFSRPLIYGVWEGYGKKINLNLYAEIITWWLEKRFWREATQLLAFHSDPLHPNSTGGKGNS